jgi:hypothetical protein
MVAGALSALAVLAIVAYGATRIAFGEDEPHGAGAARAQSSLRSGCVASVRPQRTHRGVVVAPCPRRPAAEEESHPRVQVRFAPRFVP